MKNVIKFSLKKGRDGLFIASAKDLPIVTQAQTIDEAIKNICNETKLYFKDAEKDTLVNSSSDILINYEIPFSLKKGLKQSRL